MSAAEEERFRAELLAALAWQIEMGADEAIAPEPVDRFAAPSLRGRASGDAPDAAPHPRGASGPAPGGTAAGAPSLPSDTTAEAAPPEPASVAGETARLAADAADLDALAAAMRNWTGTELHRGARSFVFSDGRPRARLMVIGEAPGAEEDRQGKPFVGRAGQLLDRMLAAIGLARDAADPGGAVYIANVLPWRPPGNRTPSDVEIEVFLPFLERHIALAGPEILMSVGNTPTRALLRTVQGIKRMRGRWGRHGASGLAVMPSFHPAYLLRQPLEKRHAWADLQAVRAALDGAAPPPDPA